MFLNETDIEITNQVIDKNEPEFQPHQLKSLYVNIKSSHCNDLNDSEGARR